MHRTYRHFPRTIQLVVVPDRVRYRKLHNQIDVVLSTALSSRTDLIVARVRMPFGRPRARRHRPRSLLRCLTLTPSPNRNEGEECP